MLYENVKIFYQQELASLFAEIQSQTFRVAVSLQIQSCKNWMATSISFH